MHKILVAQSNIDLLINGMDRFSKHCEQKFKFANTYLHKQFARLKECNFRMKRLKFSH